MFHPQGPTLPELIRQALSSTQQGYDLLAPKFDYTPFRTPQVVLEAVRDQLGPPKSIGAVLDLCCGTGAALRAIHPSCRDRLVGLDFSGGMLEVARTRGAELPADPAVEWVQGNALQLPFCEAFDLVVCFGANGHILPRDEIPFLRQIAGVLKPGGRFAFVTAEMPSKLSPGYWMARGFNGVMRVRNLLVRPPFVMYFLTFLLPKIVTLLEAEGFEVQVRRGVFAAPFDSLALVIATKPTGSTSTG